MTKYKTKKQQNLEEYISILENHNWFYFFDTISEYKKGLAEAERIMQLRLLVDQDDTYYNKYKKGRVKHKQKQKHKKMLIL